MSYDVFPFRSSFLPRTMHISHLRRDQRSWSRDIPTVNSLDRAVSRCSPDMWRSHVAERSAKELPPDGERDVRARGEAKGEWAARDAGKR